MDGNNQLNLVSRIEYIKINEYTTQSITLYWYDGQQSGDKREVVTSKDGLSVTSTSYTMDPQSGQWEYSYKTESKYNSNHQYLGSSSYYYEQGTWVYSGGDAYTYDESGRINTIMIYKEGMRLDSKVQYTYNGKGYEVITTDGAGVPLNKTFYPEDPRDGYMEIYGYDYDKEQKQWILNHHYLSQSDKYTYEYTSERYQSEGRFSKSQTRETYDDHGFILTSLNLYTSSDQSQEYESRNEQNYIRNAEGAPISMHYSDYYKSYSKESQSYNYGHKQESDVEYHYLENIDGHKVMGCEWSHPLASENTQTDNYQLDYYSGQFYIYSNNYSEVDYEYEAVPVYANGLKFEVLSDNEVSIIGYTVHPDVNFVIPATVDINGKSYKVVEIDYNAFAECKEMRSVDIPAGIRQINDDSFWDCEIEVVISRGLNIDKNYEWYSENVFCSATRRHGVLYVPADMWHEYAFSDQWSGFYNIKRNVSQARQISPQKTYTMLDSRNMQYLVYDPTSGAMQTLSSVSALDESNPNHTWMAVNTEQGSYLYNMGAKQYVEVTTSGYKLISNAVANATTQDEHGILLSNDSNSVWNFVENTQIGADPNVFGNSSGISTIEFNSNDATETYNAVGQRNNGLQPGLNLMRHTNGKAEKIIVR